jgi:hypothetical protein
VLLFHCLSLSCQGTRGLKDAVEGGGDLDGT